MTDFSLSQFNPTAVRHDELWISDGNIIIGAVSVDETHTVLFRVHKSLLCDQSEVFASMFDMPQGGVAVQSEMYEDVPFVRLLDASEDVESLLSILYNPFVLFERPKSSDTPIRLRSALRLTSKYLMTDLHTRLVQVVEREWPLCLDDFEEKEKNFEDFVNERLGYNDVIPCNDWPSQFLPEPAAAIALAEEFGITSIMPAACYDLVRCSPSHDWNDEAAVRLASTYAPGKYHKPARWACLSQGSLLKLFRLEKLLESDELLLGLVAYFKITQCEVNQDCMELWLDVVDDVRLRKMEVRDAFKVMRRFRKDLGEKNMCRACRKNALDALKRVREEAWGKVCELCVS